MPSDQEWILAGQKPGDRSSSGNDDVGRASALNIHEVADAARVSKTTVWQVVSGNRPMSQATRDKVHAVMDELRFRLNLFTQAFNSKKSHAVVRIGHDITNPLYPALAGGLEAAMAPMNQVGMLLDAGAGQSRVRAFVNDVIQRQKHRVVVAVSYLGDERL